MRTGLFGFVFPGGSGRFLLISPYGKRVCVGFGGFEIGFVLQKAVDLSNLLYSCKGRTTTVKGWVCGGFGRIGECRKQKAEDGRWEAGTGRRVMDLLLMIGYLLLNRPRVGLGDL